MTLREKQELANNIRDTFNTLLSQLERASSNMNVNVYFDFQDDRKYGPFGYVGKFWIPGELLKDQVKIGISTPL